MSGQLDCPFLSTVCFSIYRNDGRIGWWRPQMTISKPLYGGPGAGARVVASRSESERARRRMIGSGERPFCLADWSRALFIHYSIDPAILQPHVTFPLDLF